MASIRHNADPNRLPELVNLGVVARIVIGACVVGLIAALARARTLGEFTAALLAIASAGLLPLLLNLLALGALSRWLQRLSYRTGIACVIGVTLAVSILAFHVGGSLTGLDVGRVETHVLYTLIIVVLLLAYFDLRGRALSPALAESRLQALQARIRPHFLFNSINAVLSLIRSDPKRAETALEDMAELFRVLMADNRELTPLAREVELCRQYLDLEELRLGDRLKIEWFVDKMPEDALIPPLVLQPLLENAVYHGIEPRAEPGVISINIYRRGDRVHAVLRNPYRIEGSHHAGNKMAVNNIRERLALHFDAEASLDTSVENNSYQVHITVPYRKAAGK
jgi:two-component system sensor histidine kinase AlgZ